MAVETLVKQRPPATRNLYTTAAELREGTAREFELLRTQTQHAAGGHSLKTTMARKEGTSFAAAQVRSLFRHEQHTRTLAHSRSLWPSQTHPLSHLRSVWLRLVASPLAHCCERRRWRLLTPPCVRACHSATR